MFRVVDTKTYEEWETNMLHVAANFGTNTAIDYTVFRRLFKASMAFVEHKSDEYKHAWANVRCTEWENHTDEVTADDDDVTANEDDEDDAADGDDAVDDEDDAADDDDDNDVDVEVDDSATTPRQDIIWSTKHYKSTIMAVLDKSAWAKVLLSSKEYCSICLPDDAISHMDWNNIGYTSLCIFKLLKAKGLLIKALFSTAFDKSDGPDFAGQNELGLPPFFHLFSNGKNKPLLRWIIRNNLIKINTDTRKAIHDITKKNVEQQHLGMELAIHIIKGAHIATSQ